ncbi:hypothetical protein LTR56_006403 [Elasticomyces elasticus]|nr:hypothetical protein LTR56_006403 [Elasticomyces elasticus]KAK3662024.1 hypothetical protein LTR22_007195 [Elasticomyces elasticus]KAK4933191.1 hypothetical protein LTR49_000675 [Elasticomyces elasticus]KAK5756821.1 hypothetical protein LTS12_013022 [Elasticomyces elasticus]
MAAMRSRLTTALYYILLPGLIAACTGLTIGLTFLPCYSSVCVEQYYPYQTRLHIALFYTLLATLAILLAINAFSKTVQRLSSTWLFDFIFPLIDRRLSLGGLVLGIPITALAFGSIGYWEPVQQTWWEARGAAVDFTVTIHRVAWTGITGHWLDIWIGLVIIPVGRHSILGKVFNLHASGLITFHKVLAYTLFLGSLAHGVLYFTFVASVRSTAPAVHQEFLVDDPYVTVADAGDKIPLNYLVLPTGGLAFILILLVLITSLPALRRKAYNIFYITHVISAVLITVLTSLHASTNFYFLLPGLVLWVADWALRVQYSLRKLQDIEVENAGNGWYRVSLPYVVPGTQHHLEKGPAMATEVSPLATYYINIPSVSKTELHPFTAAVVASDTSAPVLLFRQAPERKQDKKSMREWTWRVASAVDAGAEKRCTIPARIEGPYTPVVSEMLTADHFLLVVGGSGITGALSIANWWASHHSPDPSRPKTVRLVWTVRSADVARVDEFRLLQGIMDAREDTEYVVHDSSGSGRLSCEDEVNRAAREGRMWVYASGPEGLLGAVEKACQVRARGLRKGAVDESSGKHSELSWYVARWS